MKNKIICIIFFNCVLFLLIIQIFKNPVIDEYSKINKELYNLNLNQFNFYRAEEAKNLSNYINIFFCLKMILMSIIILNVSMIFIISKKQ